MYEGEQSAITSRQSFLPRQCIQLRACDDESGDCNGLGVEDERRVGAESIETDDLCRGEDSFLVVFPREAEDGHHSVEEIEW